MPALRYAAESSVYHALDVQVATEVARTAAEEMLRESKGGSVLTRPRIDSSKLGVELLDEDSEVVLTTVSCVR